MELEPMSEQTSSELLSEVNETEERLNNNRALIQEWFRCQPHLPADLFDERIIDPFLRGCKHNLERTKCKLDMYYTCRTLYPDLFVPSKTLSICIQQNLKAFNIVPLPKPTADGCRITMHRIANNIDLSTFDPRVTFQLMFMIGDIRLLEEPPIIGDIFIFDVKHLTAGVFSKIINPYLKSALHCVQDAYPQRLKEIHLFNAPPLIDRVVSFFKQFVKEKIRNRFHIHTGIESVYNFIPQSHLPEDYGGDLLKLDKMQDFWVSKLQSYHNYFHVHEKAKSDESKRPHGSKVTFDLGCDGSFRKLAVD